MGDDELDPEMNLAVVGPVDRERQKRLRAYLTANDRHEIFQTILGHPAHLMSRTELAYNIPSLEGSLEDVLAELTRHDILTEYQDASEAADSATPSTFWGLTANGVRLLRATGHLKALPVLRAVHDATHKPERIKRHETALRPDLPDPVSDALNYDEPQLDDSSPAAPEYRLSGDDLTLFADSIDEDTASLNNGADGNRTLDELF